MAKKDFYTNAVALDYGARWVHLDAGGTTLTADRTLVFDVQNANKTISLGGNLTLGGPFTTQGAFAVILTATNFTSLTLPTSGTLLTDGSNAFTGAQSIGVAGSTTTGSLLFNGATMNWIDFGSTGAAAPAYTTRSVGTKLVLSNNLTAGTVDFAIGMEPNYLWFSATNNTTSTGFKWYGGNVQVATLTGTGALTLSSTITATSGGTGSAANFSSTGTTTSGTIVATDTGSYGGSIRLSDGTTSVIARSAGGIFYISKGDFSGDRLSINTNGDTTINGRLTSSGVYFPADNAFTAGTNAQGQGVLDADIVVITSTPNNPSGVTLPARVSFLGRSVCVINKGTNPVYVYPDSGSQIDALGANVAQFLQVNGVITFYQVNVTQWYSTFNEVSSQPSAFIENDQTVAQNYTITANKNAISGGPITISTGVSVTIPTGATWSIV